MAEQLSTLSAVRAALADLRGTTPITAFAREVRIAPATLQKLLTLQQCELEAEFFAWMTGQWPDWKQAESKSGTSPEQSPKAIAGRAESISRIYAYLINRGRTPGILIEEFARLFGVDPQVSQAQSLKRWIDWVNPDDPFVTQDDPTLKRIVMGQRDVVGHPDREPNVVRAGILAWPPYCDRNKIPQSSFAGRMMLRLLGSLNPLKWGAPELTVLEFHQILHPDMLRNGQLDAIFSLYDLPSRRLAGFEFIHIPGLMAPLDAISFYSHDDVPKGISWSDILDPSEDLGLQVFVINGDAAHLLVRGACAYPDERIFINDDMENMADLLDNVTEQLIEQARSYETARKGVILGKSPPSPFVFLADADMVTDVAQKFAEKAARIPEIASMVRAMDDKEEHCPRYPIGIAVSANSPRWRNILEDTLIRELFVNAGPQTARQYAELLARPSKVSVGPLGDLIPSASRDTFVRGVVKALQEKMTEVQAQPMRTEANRIHITKRLDEIKKCWQVQAGETL